MQPQDLVQYIKDSCLVDDPNIVEDSEFIALTDEQIQSILLISASKCRANISNLKEEDLYKVVLVTKKEIYYRLALKSAPLYTIEGDAGSLNRSERFEHYYDLIAIVEEEYANYIKELENNRDVSNTDNYGQNYTQGEIFLSSRYFSQRNMKHATKPQIVLKQDKVYKDHVELSWQILRLNQLKKIELYINKDRVIDPYDLNNLITPSSTKVLESQDIHKNMVRIEKLEPSTTYHIAVVITELNDLQGYSEIEITTVGEEPIATTL